MSNTKNRFLSEFRDLCEEMNDTKMMIYDADFETKCFSYSEVLRLCRRYITFFQQHGLRQGDTIITILPNSPEAVLCFFAAIMYGIHYAPLPCSVTNREFYNWVSIVKPGLIVKKKGVADYETPIAVIDCNCDGDLTWIGIDEADIAFERVSSQIYLMTSGTTGTPKAMSINADSLWQSGIKFVKHYKIENSFMRFWNYLPMSYLGGLFNLALIPLCCKGSFVISEPFSGKTILNFWNYVKKHSITALWFVPSIIQGLMKLSLLVGKNIYGDVCKNIKLAFLGTAPITLHQKTEFEERFGIRLYENFALSETTFLTAEKDDDIRFREQGSVGVPVPYVEIKIIPVEGVKGSGLIWVKTPYLFNGYLSEAGVVDIETDEEGFFNTKDIGHFNEDGVLVLDGRDRDIIKKGGLFVSLTEIEHVAMSYPDVEEAAAVAIKHDFYGEAFCLFVKLKSFADKERTLKEMHLWMIDNFVSYKIPEKILSVDDFPRTMSGKIQKTKLLTMMEDFDEQ